MFLKHLGVCRYNDRYDFPLMNVLSNVKIEQNFTCVGGVQNRSGPYVMPATPKGSIQTLLLPKIYFLLKSQ